MPALKMAPRSIGMMMPLPTVEVEVELSMSSKLGFVKAYLMLTIAWYATAMPRVISGGDARA